MKYYVVRDETTWLTACLPKTAFVKILFGDFVAMRRMIGGVGYRMVLFLVGLFPEREGAN